MITFKSGTMSDMKGATAIWVGRYEGFYFPRSGHILVDVNGIRHCYDSLEEAEDALDMMEWTNE